MAGNYVERRLGDLQIDVMRIFANAPMRANRAPWNESQTNNQVYLIYYHNDQAYIRA